MANSLFKVKSIEHRKLATIFSDGPVFNAIRFCICFAILLAMVAVVIQNFEDIKGLHTKLNPLFATLSICCLLVYYLLMVAYWYVITVMYGIALPYLNTQSVWTYSMLGKYLPGKIWLVAGRFYYYSREGKPSSSIVAALFTEGAMQLATSCAVVLVCLFGFRVNISIISDGFTKDPITLIVVLLSMLIIVVHPKIMIPTLNFIRCLSGRKPLELSIKARQIYSLLVVGIFVKGIGGLSIFLFVNAFLPVGWDHYFFLTGTMALSGLLGMLAVFAPGGIGVREASIAYCLSFVLPSGLAATIGLTARIWMICAELMLLSIVYVLNRVLRE